MAKQFKSLKKYFHLKNETFLYFVSPQSIVLSQSYIYGLEKLKSVWERILVGSDILIKEIQAEGCE